MVSHRFYISDQFESLVQWALQIVFTWGTQQATRALVFVYLFVAFNKKCLYLPGFCLYVVINKTADRNTFINIHTLCLSLYIWEKTHISILIFSHRFQYLKSPRTPAPAPSSLRSSPPCQMSSSAIAVATCSQETTWLPKSGTSTWRASPWRHTRCVTHHMC